MCSVNDIDLEGDTLIPIEKDIDLSDKNCKKCAINPASVVLRKKDTYCKECFLASSTHKFRASLGKNKSMRPADKVLIAYSGSSASEALLHLLRSGLNEDCHKKLLFNAVVGYIEEGAVQNKTLSSRKEVLLSVKKQIDSFNFETYFTTLNQSMLKTPHITKNEPMITESDDEGLMKLFENVTSMSAKEDLLLRLRQKLLYEMAAQSGCNKIFTAEVGTDLAVKLLSCVSLGRGIQLPLEVGFSDSRHPNITVLRPLRDLTKKEIAFYNVFLGLSPVCPPSLTTLASHDVSIQKLTEKFVTDLQEEFPSTVYTVFRTGDKLSLAEGSLTEEEQVCLLCRGNVRGAGGEYDAVEATEFSREVSTGGRREGSRGGDCGGEKEGECCGGGSCGTKTASSRLRREELEQCFCYGCMLIIREMTSVECLPLDILEAARSRCDLRKMKEQISDFLL